MKLLNGHKIADKIYQKIKRQLRQSPFKIKPSLAVILIGANPASRLYVTIKQERAAELGIKFKKYLLPGSTRQSQIINLIEKLNRDKEITAILVQLPLPKKFNTQRIIAAIHHNKDADGIHPRHLELLKGGHTPPILPATTLAILAAIKSTRVNLKNKSIAIIGKSQIVGLPAYYYLKNKSRKINLYDSSTKNLAAKAKRADILIVAIGSPKFITDKYIKKNAVLIDVGINKVNGQTIGDIDFNSAKSKASFITPVPGGVGPITVACLLENTLKLFKLQKNTSD